MHAFVKATMHASIGRYLFLHKFDSNGFFLVIITARRHVIVINRKVYNTLGSEGTVEKD